MSKAVINEKVIQFGSEVLNYENLHAIVMRVWEDGRHLPAISRAFVENHQVVCAILENNGGNDYLGSCWGMSFGIWRGNKDG